MDNELKILLNEYLLQDICDRILKKAMQGLL